MAVAASGIGDDMAVRVDDGGALAQIRRHFYDSDEPKL